MGRVEPYDVLAVRVDRRPAVEADAPGFRRVDLLALVRGLSFADVKPFEASEVAGLHSLSQLVEQYVFFEGIPKRIGGEHHRLGTLAFRQWPEHPGYRGPLERNHELHIPGLWPSQGLIPFAPRGSRQIRREAPR